MFSRAEEERLNYLKQGRRIQANEAVDPASPDLFQNKIPASFMGSQV
jgi:hypothetical protein